MVLLIALHLYVESARRKEIKNQYGDGERGELVLKRQIFQGMSQWELITSWGHPDEKETTLSKSKCKETWMYGKAGRGYSNRVFLEDGYVVGWKEKRS
jgi:hypothetical protein